jgi:steroid 5-alpha reductase family enzyme
MQKLKTNRTASFIIIAIIYVLAIITGIVVYKILSFDWWLNLLLADVAATILTFIFSLILKNSSVYDAYWSVQPMVILVGLSIGKSLGLLQILLLIAVCYWGIRLTVNWAYNFTDFQYQDWRYVMLKEKTGHFYPVINFIGIHMVPTIVVYFCTIPAAYAIINGLDANIGSIIFILVSIFAATFQGIADIQMHKYRKNRTTPFNRNGLWKYSRHPNYLGEILMWWGIGFAVVVSDFNLWWLLLGALLNTILFLTTSIPLAEKRQSRKEGFSEYKKETRYLLPIKRFR